MVGNKPCQRHLTGPQAPWAATMQGWPELRYKLFLLCFKATMGQVSFHFIWFTSKVRL